MVQKMDIRKLSSKYNVRRLEDKDIQDIFNLCCKNKLFYKYCPPFVTRESIQKDMCFLPPNIQIEDKYYVGYYEGETLIAVMDLICDYPEKGIAFIGFFMTSVDIQNRGVGSKIILELCDSLKQEGFGFARLAWVKGNPEAEYFWRKNKFVELKETKAIDNAPYTVILAERKLS